MPNGGHYNRKTAERKKPTHPALARRLARGLKKLRRKRARQAERANRISPNHPFPRSAPEPDSSGSGATPTSNTSQEAA